MIADKILHRSRTPRRNNRSGPEADIAQPGNRRPFRLAWPGAAAVDPARGAALDWAIDRVAARVPGVAPQDRASQRPGAFPGCTQGTKAQGRRRRDQPRP